MSLGEGDNLGDFTFEGGEHWYLASAYRQEGPFLSDDGQSQEHFNSEINYTFEPDDLELEPRMSASDSASPKRHTMPNIGLSSISPNSHLAGCATQLTSTSPKRAGTYPSAIEGLNIARSRKLIDTLLSKIDPGTTSISSDNGSEISDTNNVAQSLQVDPITDLACDEWPVPTFFLDHIEGPTPPQLDHADGPTPHNPERSSRAIANSQSKHIEDNETNDYCSMLEDQDSVPPLNAAFGAKPGPYFKVTHSDSGIGSSTMSYRHGPQSNMGSSYRHSQSRRDGKSSRSSQAKGSVMFDRASVTGSTTAGRYQQVAAKLGPLTSAASSTAGSVETPRMLSETALKTMKTIILEPILKDDTFRDFWYICHLAGEQMESGQIGSLRDLEKFLFHKASNIKNNQAYNIFCKAFLNHVRESLKYMPQNELLRPYDRPYDPGYFLDTLAPFDKHTMQSTILELLPEEEEELGAAFKDWLNSTTSHSQKRVAGTDNDAGNLAKRHKSNRPELILSTAVTQDYLNSGYDAFSADHMVHGNVTQMTTNTRLISPPLPAPSFDLAHQRRQGKNKVKRRSTAHQAREQLLFKCAWPNCHHPRFARACDLTKHEKTHTRPHKCIVAGCKYAQMGFPTEKERDRHWTDKHSAETPNFACIYTPCPYKSKRESNCKQHMEKAHGYEYVRMKQNYNKPKGQQNFQQSPAGHRSSVSALPAAQQNSDPESSIMVSQYPTADCASPRNSGLPTSGEQYSGQFIRDYLLMNSQPNGIMGSPDAFMISDQETLDSLERQQYTQSPSEQPPYPDSMDPRFLMYIPMPQMPPMSDENIDPSLQLMSANMDGRVNLGLGSSRIR